MYYDFDNRLKEDAALAEKEWSAVGRVTDGIKHSVIGSPAAIIRLVMFLLPVVALLMPAFKLNGSNVNLVSIIKQVISSSSEVFGNTASLLVFVTFAAAIAFALVNLVISLFSFTKYGLTRNIIFTIIGVIVFAGVGIAAAESGATIILLGGFWVAVVLMLVQIPLHRAVNKRIER